MKYITMLLMFSSLTSVAAPNTVNVECTEDAAKLILYIAYMKGCADHSNLSEKVCMQAASKFVEEVTKKDE